MSIKFEKNNIKRKNMEKYQKNREDFSLNIAKVMVIYCKCEVLYSIAHRLN